VVLSGRLKWRMMERARGERYLTQWWCQARVNLKLQDQMIERERISMDAQLRVAEINLRYGSAVH